MLAQGREGQPIAAMAGQQLPDLPPELLRCQSRFASSNNIVLAAAPCCCCS